MITLLEKLLAQPFEYGQMDCGLFAATIVAENNKEVRKILKTLKGKYKTETGGIRVLSKYLKAKGIKAKDPFEGVLNHLFGDPVAPLQGRTGDVALGDWGEGRSFGIVEDARIVVVSDAGLIRLPISQAEKVWHVTRG